MKIFKNVALGLLSFLLFLSLSTFGLALTLNNTILSPDFVTSELDKIEVSLLAEELISEQIPDGEFPEEFDTALVNTIAKLEPEIKEQVGAATYIVYDYLLGKSQSLNLALTLRNTILSTDFVASVVDELDITSLAEEFLSEQLAEVIPQEIGYLGEYVDDAIVKLEPTIKEELIAATDPILDYLLGESQSFNIVISIEPVMVSLKDTLREAFLESPPAELANLTQSTLEQYFNEHFEEFAEVVQSTFELDETLLGIEIPGDIAEKLVEAEEGFEQAKQGIGYFQLGYKLLIGFTLLLILGIILINRQVKGATRKLGIIFLSYGALEYIGTFIAKHFAGQELIQLTTSSQLQSWLQQLLNDFITPIQMFSLGLLIGGIVLIVVSFVYKPR